MPVAQRHRLHVGPTTMYAQLASILRARYCDPRIRSVTKTDGLTWKVKEILQRVLTLTK